MSKNCPFCGGEGLIVKVLDLHLWRVCCYRCHSKGALGKTEKEAIEKWNSRVKDPMEIESK